MGELEKLEGCVVVEWIADGLCGDACESINQQNCVRRAAWSRILIELDTCL